MLFSQYFGDPSGFFHETPHSFMLDEKAEILPYLELRDAINMKRERLFNELHAVGVKIRVKLMMLQEHRVHKPVISISSFFVSNECQCTACC